MTPIFAALGGALAAFVYLRLVGDDTMLRSLGLYLAVGLGGAAGLLLGKRLVRKS